MSIFFKKVTSLFYLKNLQEIRCCIKVKIHYQHLIHFWLLHLIVVNTHPNLIFKKSKILLVYYFKINYLLLLFVYKKLKKTIFFWEKVNKIPIYGKFSFLKNWFILIWFLKTIKIISIHLYLLIIQSVRWHQWLISKISLNLI